MNVPPKEFVLVSEDRELAFLEACFARSGLAAEDGQLIARLLTNSELRGVRSHGIGWAPGYCQQLREGRLNPRPHVRLVHQTPSMAVLDGDGGLGYVPMVQVTERAVEKARQTGVGIGLVRHIGHYGAAGHYTRQCLEAGCVGFSVQGFRGEGEAGQRQEKPPVAFPGAPPMSFAIPAAAEPSPVLDMVAHALSGYRGPEYADLPERIPAAFFKSIGLVATANLLGGALTGFTLPEGDRIEKRWPGARAGGMVLAIDVASVVPVEVFTAEVDRYSQAIRQTYAPLPGYDEALLPGAVEERVLARHRREGIRFGPEEQEAARKLSRMLDVPVPWG